VVETFCESESHTEKRGRVREHRKDDALRAKELEAVARLREGDVGGLEVLVRRYQVRAVRAAHLIVGDPALAQDVVQDAFVRAYEHIGRFDPERSFEPWFMRIVINGSITAASRKRRRVHREVPLETAGTRGAVEAADREPSPHELAERAELRKRVLEVLDGLPPAQRAVVVQRYYLGMSEAEMSGGGSSPPGTIKWRLHAARKKLSEILHPPSFSAAGAQANVVVHNNRPKKEDHDERA
jgi:RNA polymerase sigma-70 factor (ECF subfamily)